MKRVLVENINTVAHWNDELVTGKYDHFKIDDFKKQLIANYVTNNSAIVDFGCGNGHVLKYLFNLYSNVKCVGIDHASEMMKKLNYETPVITWLDVDIYNTGLKNFDYALCNEFLEHIEEPEKCIKEMARVLRDGGKLIGTTPLQNIVDSREHIWSFEYEDIKRMMDGYFKQSFVFPFSSRAMIIDTATGNTISPAGSWDTILFLAIK